MLAPSYWVVAEPHRDGPATTWGDCPDHDVQAAKGGATRRVLPMTGLRDGARGGPDITISHSVILCGRRRWPKWRLAGYLPLS